MVIAGMEIEEEIVRSRIYLKESQMAPVVEFAQFYLRGVKRKSFVGAFLLFLCMYYYMKYEYDMITSAWCLWLRVKMDQEG